jgi:hypothetical protein
MKRGGIRTNRKYITDKDGKRIIQYEIQGRKNKIWIPVVVINKKTKKQEPMIYDTLGEAETELLKIAKQIRGK